MLPIVSIAVSLVLLAAVGYRHPPPAITRVLAGAIAGRRAGRRAATW
jgi:hypothetical protein